MIFVPAGFAGKKFKVLAFDFDETLLDKKSFDYPFWFVELPDRVSKKQRIPFTDALYLVIDAFLKLESCADWYRPSHWFSFFHLRDDWRQAIRSMDSRARFYPDVVPTLKALRAKNKYKIVVLSNSITEFLDKKLKDTRSRGLFDAVYSAIDDFGNNKRHETFEFFARKMKKDYGVEKHEILHVGDNYEEDYELPKELGIPSLWINRGMKQEGRDTIHSLKELLDFF
ncbi:MAG TPA: HAD family hydrolase [archaeon]|nr:HAD family hydrolase [archaeon]